MDRGLRDWQMTEGVGRYERSANLDADWARFIGLVGPSLHDPRALELTLATGEIFRLGKTTVTRIF
jgi:hypothetical protein